MSTPDIHGELSDLPTPGQSARESAWAAESERRIDAFEAGKLTARDAKDVFADLAKKYPAQS
jgi:hypothetical protein